MRTFLLILIPVLGVAAFFALPAAVALSRTETDRTGGAGTIPQQRDRRAGGDA